MHADNSHHLIAAAQRRHETARAKATQALRDLDREGGAVTFQIVAQKAHVSRSWLYTQDDICAEVRRLRGLQHGFVNVGWPHHVRFGWLHPWARLV